MDRENKIDHVRVRRKPETELVVLAEGYQLLPHGAPDGTPLLAGTPQREALGNASYPPVVGIPATQVVIKNRRFQKAADDNAIAVPAFLTYPPKVTQYSAVN